MGKLQKQSQGSILIVTIFVLTILTIFAVNIGIGINQKLLFLKKITERKTLSRIAEAGIKTAILEIKKDISTDCDTIGENWANNSLFKNYFLEEGSFTISYQHDFLEIGREEIKRYKKIRYGVQDEESKININTCDTKTLTKLLKIVLNIKTEDAENLACSIIDWRDEDSAYQHPQYGAEDSDYRHLPNPYESKDAPYEVLEELLLVKGIDEEIYKKIKNYITIYSNGKININTAPFEVLISLGLDEKLVIKIISFRYGNDLIEDTGDDNIFVTPSDIIVSLNNFCGLNEYEISQLNELIESGKITTSSTNFMIESIARLDKKEENTYKITVVVDRKGKIKYWREE